VTQTNPVTETTSAAAVAAAAAAAIWEAAKFGGTLPSVGDDVTYVGKGIASTAEDVWNWVTGTAAKAVGAVVTAAVVTVDEVTAVVEAYGGQLLKSALSITDDLATAVATEFTLAYGALDYVSGALADSIDGIDTLLGNVDGVVTGIEDVTIPAILGYAIGVAASIEPTVLEGLANVETWAIDNIKTPLLDDIANAETVARTDVVATAGQIYDWAKSELNTETLARVAAIAGVAAAVAGITSWVDDCGEPMCSTFGPKTDLGKILKALDTASGVAFFAYLASLDGNGIKGLLGSLDKLAGGVIDDIESIFVGGETVGQAVGGIVGL
jgi:hypothetical protein